MTIPTDSEKVLLRNRQQSTTAYLSIFQPQIVMKCRVNDASIAKGAMSITYDGATGGIYTSVEADFMMYVGTTDGGKEKGIIRIRSITNTVISVAENSHIKWANDDYLTIFKYVEIVPIFTRIIENPSVADDVIFYKDYDIAYTNQNSVLGAFPVVGCHFAGFLNDAGQCLVYYSASGTSHVVDGTSLSYAWWFDGATVTGSFAQTPGYITYETPGHYVTRTYISGSNGSIDYTYRYVSIYDRPDKGTSWPILDWSMSNLSGSRESGGYKGTVKVYSDVPISSIRDNAIVVIFTDDWYGSINQSIGGNSPNRSNIRFVGYILNGTIRQNYKAGWIEFDIASPTNLMQEMESFSVSVESKVSPSKWYELADMNGKKAVFHYLNEHSTVLKVCDLHYEAQDYRIQYFDADRESLYDAIHTFVDNTYWADFVSDRQGLLWIETRYDALSMGSGIAQSLSLDRDDWMGEPVIDERQINETSFIEMGGIYYEGPTTNGFGAFLCATPGNAPAYRGRSEKFEGLALSSQNHLNGLAGNVFAHRNSRYPNVELNLAGNYSNFDIAPQELILLTVAEEDTSRGIVFTNKLFAITSVDNRFDFKKLFSDARINTTEIVEGVPADTVTIPAAPPTAPDGGGGKGGYEGGTITPYQPQELTIDIYHNNAFVGSVNKLNFIDDMCTGSYG